MEDWLPILVLVLVVAPVLGSFAGLLVDRLPTGGAVAFDRSRCSCGRVLGPAELVPILSFLVQRGRCRGCGQPIPRETLWIELAAVAIAALAAGLTGDVVEAGLGTGLGLALLVLGLIDWRALWLPDVLTLPLLAAGLGVTAWRLPDQLLDHLLAAAIGWATLLALAAIYRRWRGREGLGGGDAKLLAAAGAWLGIAALPYVVLLAALGALAWAVITGRTDPTTELPFGSFLAAAIWLTWLAAVAYFPV